MDYMSDLHLDNGARGGPKGWFGKLELVEKTPDATTLIVAGDTGEYIDDTVDFLNACVRQYDFVVGCFGNHEKGPLTKILDSHVYILDLEPDYRIDHGGTAFIGACLKTGNVEQANHVEASIRIAWEDDTIKQVIVLSHYVPLDTLELITNHMDSDKCNGFLSRLPDDPPKPTIVVFGHLHLEIDMLYRGYRLVHNPRGYRGLRRDNSAFHGVKPL